MNKLKDTRIFGDLIVDDSITKNNKEVATEEYVDTKLSAKQDKLTLDSGQVLGRTASGRGEVEAIDTTQIPSWAMKPNKPTYDYSDIGGTKPPTNAQKNSDITKAEIEAKLTGPITSHTHSYNNLSNKPTIPTIPSVMTTTEGNTGTATTQRTINAANLKSIILNHSPAGARPSSWSQVSGKPSFATVATSGSYADLTNKPTIPAAQVQSNWNATTGMGVILNKPNLATVATSGSYNDLSNKPSIPSIPSILSIGEGETGTATTQRTINAKNLKEIILHHAAESTHTHAYTNITELTANTVLGRTTGDGPAELISTIQIPSWAMGDIPTAEEVGARPEDWTPTWAEVDGLTENGKIKSSILPDTFQNLTNGSSNLPYRFDLIVYGDSDKYYPVHFAGGNQDLLRTIKIWRRYNEQAPNDWNTSTHKGSLNLEWKGNYGGWGGAVYNQWIYENTSQYTTLLAGTQLVDNSYAMAFFLRGGGTTGAIYHIASDQPLTWTSSYLTYTKPTAFYNQEKTFAHTNSSYDRNAPAPRTTVNTSQINSITVIKGNDSRLTNARTPTAHSHTKAQITDFAHTHTRSQITDFAHTHTKSQITDFAHNHDDRYYTEGETNTLLNAKQDKLTLNSGQVLGRTASGTGEVEAINTININQIKVSDLDESSLYALKTDIPTAVTNIATQRLLGRYSTGTGNVQPITLGSNLTLSTGGVLSATNTVYTHPNSGVTAGTYRSVTVNSQGHVTAGTNPTTLTGYGITLSGDVTNSNNVITIGPKKVTLSKIQDISTGKVLGRTTGGTGIVEELDLIDIGEITPSNWTQVWSGAINLNSYRSSFYSATVPSNSYIGKRIAIEVQYGSGTTYTSKIIFGVLGSNSATAASTSISRGIGWNYFDGTYLRIKTLFAYTSTSNTSAIYVGHLKTLFGKFSGTTIEWSTSYSETLYMKKIWVIE